ncbi:HdeD family acid-resistance protein [Planctomycetota bacterium]|nr:HdeD family acid-resistance protein [Planctomycetota bacterium]
MAEENTPDKQNIPHPNSSHPLHPTKAARGWFIALGIIFLVLGTLAILLPGLGTIGATLFIGWLLIVSGILQFAHAFATQQGGHKAWQIVIGILGLIAGFLLVFEPIQGAYAVTLVLAFYFIFIGVARLSASSKLKAHQRIGWIIASGIIDILLAILIIIFWPSDALWVPGLIVGIELIFSGWSMIMLGNVPVGIIADLTGQGMSPEDSN